MTQDIRASFEMDKEMRDQIDKYAREQGITRGNAILNLITEGCFCLSKGEPIEVTNQHVFEEYKEIRRNIADLKKELTELREEVSLMHHIIEVEWGDPMHNVPYQSRRWYEFWKQKSP